MKGSIVWTTEMVSTKKPLCELTGLKRTTGSYVETTPPTPFFNVLIYIYPFRTATGNFEHRKFWGGKKGVFVI